MRQNVLFPNLRTALAMRGMSQNDLAKAIGVSQSAVAQLSCGLRHALGPSKKAQAAKILKVDFNWLFQEAPPPPPAKSKKVIEPPELVEAGGRS